MKKKFGSYDNFQIVNADFETYDFGNNQFDLVYSAAAIQWIPEEIAFSKVYNILKNNGTLAMIMTHTDFHCGNRHDRDINASRNILQEGLRIIM